MRYIPIPGLYFNLYVLTDKIHPLTQDGLRYLELLKKELAKLEY